MTDASPTLTLDDVRHALRTLPDRDLDSETAALTRQSHLTKPAGSLGRLEDLAAWVAAWQGRHPPAIQRSRIAVFAGNHGVAVHGVSAYPATVTAQMVANFQAGGGAVNQLAAAADAELRVYELDLDHPTADFTAGPAMTEEGLCRALAYGMLVAEPGVDLLCLGEMGIANTTSASALCAVLFGGAPSDWAGPGTGVDEAGVARKAEVIARGLAANPGAVADPLEALRCFGGFELAAITGAVLAARLAKIPVILDGFACTAAAGVLHRLDGRALDHCLVAHCSAEPGHQRLLGCIGKQPLLDLRMRLGEASGAALAISIVKAALACHNGMATFESAGVSGRGP